MVATRMLPICLLASSSALLLHPTAPYTPVAKPLLRIPRFQAARLQTVDASVPLEPLEPEKPTTLKGKVQAMLPPADEMKKLVPLAIMFFCILFSYTILRDTKDVLVVTAPGGSAEVIPFLKTYVNLPGAIAFTVAYSAAANRLGSQALFYCTLTPFLAFFGSFAAFIYPMRHVLHPNGFADFLGAALPAGFAAPIGVLRNWTYSLFYLLANMWGSVVVSLMFWGFANEITTVSEAKKYYPLFGMFANVALVFSGQFVRYVSQMKSRLPVGVDPWGVALNYLMSGVVASGLVVMGCFRYLNKNVLQDGALPAAEGEKQVKKKKKKPNMTMGESFRYLAGSRYIRNLFVLVVAYGMSINMVEVTWKGKLKQAFPDPTDYSSFMGAFSSATGVATLGMMFVGRWVFGKFGWGPAAMITPLVLLATGLAFFGLSLFEGPLAPVCAALGTTPLMLAVFVGAAQNIMSKAAKYSLFDPCKEMAYIPLDQEQKTKGKAAIDVIGGPLGKSGGSLIQQALIFGVGSLAASTPYLGVILAAIIGMWIFSARQLSGDFALAMEKVDESA